MMTFTPMFFRTFEGSGPISLTMTFPQSPREDATDSMCLRWDSPETPSPRSTGTSPSSLPSASNIRNLAALPNPESAFSPSDDATAYLSGSFETGIIVFASGPHPPEQPPKRANSCDLSSPRSPMASARHCLQWRMILASREHLSMRSRRSSGVGERKFSKGVPFTGMSGSMFTV